ncbi:uncharacterized protein LOC132069267 [Lycium ferocissimum]|uniref:uncharacterized protein LOC132069267 n=1 Tax=Lycium ferocissimum TaxID=112874 RepID=UPI002815D779|nr:uncharacterized protein LOC132069267 [Lycium ferocissimum]
MAKKASTPMRTRGSYAENRSKKINDPRRSADYVDSKSKQQEKVKKVSQMGKQNKRKAGNNVANVKGKKIAKTKHNVDEDDDGEVYLCCIFNIFSSFVFFSSVITDL